MTYNAGENSQPAYAMTEMGVANTALHNSGLADSAYPPKPSAFQNSCPPYAPVNPAAAQPHPARPHPSASPLVCDVGTPYPQGAVGSVYPTHPAGSPYPPHPAGFAFPQAPHPTRPLPDAPTPSSYDATVGYTPQ